MHPAVRELAQKALQGRVERRSVLRVLGWLGVSVVAARGVLGAAGATLLACGLPGEGSTCYDIGDSTGRRCDQGLVCDATETCRKANATPRDGPCTVDDECVSPLACGAGTCQPRCATGWHGGACGSAS